MDHFVYMLNLIKNLVNHIKISLIDKNILVTIKESWKSLLKKIETDI